ncbi:hypothetical protein [Massilia sp.]|uniref:hypothetical protein n=1 Tax=Massilia sp. TaxID=1882437 RepID=UPI0028B0A0FB|nr:hypothetical protein [Massilia sp.]
MANDADYPGAAARRLFRNGVLAVLLLASVPPALATPAPPLAPLLRQADMTVTVQLIEAKNGVVSKITTLCKVSGKIPVYANSDSPASWPKVWLEAEIEIVD